MYCRFLATLALLATVAAAVLGTPARVSAQGLLIIVDPETRIRLPRPVPMPTPVPQMTYKIKEIGIQAKLVEQVAQVQVSQSFVNTGSRQMEVVFVFPLPYDGAIDRLTLMVDDHEYPAQLMKATEARKIYEEIVRRSQDPALLEWMGSGMFKTSVFPVPPGAERKVTLRYSQLCRKDHTLTDFLFPLSTAKYTSHAVEKVDIRVAIESQQEIRNVYSPTHSVEIKRPDSKHAVVQYTSTNQVPTGDFRLFYDVVQQGLGASVLSYRPQSSDEGFFLMLATPPTLETTQQLVNKTMLFVLDRSGSMSGDKITQAREAIKFVLNNLRDGDTFNIIAYDSTVESFRPELQRFTPETRSQAIGFVEGIYAGGGTNIDGALTAALNQLQDTKRPTYVIFLTDGLPTVGEKTESRIVQNAERLNKVNARIINFGVGYDVNSKLLEHLARANRGQTEYVRPNENIEEHVGRLYAKISQPILTNVSVAFEFDSPDSVAGAPISRVYPKGQYDLFAGEQLVLAGRYKKSGPAKITIRGTINSNEQVYHFPADFTNASGDESYGFVEKLWAMRRIGEILDDIDLHGQNEEMVKELVELSTKHGILTPYTSFLADDGTNLRTPMANVRRAGEQLLQLRDESGQAGFVGRAERNRLQAAAQAPAPSATTAPAGPGLGTGGGMVNGKAAQTYGGAFYRDLAKDADVAAKNLVNVGNRAFYQRQTDRRWVDPTVTEAMEQKAIRVTQFSDEYFALASRHGRRLSQYMVFDDPVLVNVDGQAYLIDPPAKN